MKKKFLFIDRDGTLIKEPNDNKQVDKIEKLSFEPNVITSLLKLQKFGFKLIMVTNQDGLGTHLFPKKNFYIPHNFMIDIFTSQGINFEKVLICPHFDYDKCNCRKPNTGLVNSFLTGNLLDKKNSFVIGDRYTDILLSKNMNINGLLYNKTSLNWLNISKNLTTLKRYSCVKRITKETDIKIKVWLDQKKTNYINTGIKFLDHMLHQIAIHGGISVYIKAIGDIKVDDHHTVEDVALVLGETLKRSLGNKYGISRFGFIAPMDESLATCALDISGRSYLKYNAKYKFQKVGDLSTDMVEHFFRSLCSTMFCTLHLSVSGDNDHHKIESLFKSFGLSLRQAININYNSNKLQSSKGII
ncbi:MAG: bifunctional histidinol-phosphatase/imidazoleglycerol-phosphate dehydratase HisB [Enterobacterales bacterium]